MSPPKLDYKSFKLHVKRLLVACLRSAWPFKVCSGNAVARDGCTGIVVDPLLKLTTLL